MYTTLQRVSGPTGSFRAKTGDSRSSFDATSYSTNPTDCCLTIGWPSSVRWAPFTDFGIGLTLVRVYCIGWGNIFHWFDICQSRGGSVVIVVWPSGRYRRVCACATCQNVYASLARSQNKSLNESFSENFSLTFWISEPMSDLLPMRESPIHVVLWPFLSFDCEPTVLYIGADCVGHSMLWTYFTPRTRFSY